MIDEKNIFDSKYESPIKIIQQQLHEQIQMDFENNIMKAVQSYAIDVNKEELLKALKYDREQYDKGFSDCKAIYEEKLECVLEELRNIAEKYVYSSDEYEQGKFFAYSNASEIVKEVGA